jgi:hypothetical protein
MDAGRKPRSGWKPDKARFVVYPHRSSPNLQVAVDPSFPNAWTKPPYYAPQGLGAGAKRSTAHSSSCAFATRDRPVAGSRLRYRGSRPRRRNLVARDFTPAGYTYRVEVKRSTATVQPLPQDPKAQSQSARSG